MRPTVFISSYGSTACITITNKNKSGSAIYQNLYYGVSFFIHLTREREIGAVRDISAITSVCFLQVHGLRQCDYCVCFPRGLHVLLPQWLREGGQRLVCVWGRYETLS